MNRCSLPLGAGLVPGDIAASQVSPSLSRCILKLSAMLCSRSYEEGIRIALRVFPCQSLHFVGTSHVRLLDIAQGEPPLQLLQPDGSRWNLFLMVICNWKYALMSKNIVGEALIDVCLVLLSTRKNSMSVSTRLRLSEEVARVGWR